MGVDLSLESMYLMLLLVQSNSHAGEEGKLCSMNLCMFGCD